MNYLWISCLLFTEGFLIKNQRRILSRTFYKGNRENANQLLGIDYKLERYKKMMKRLLQEKQELIKNITDINLTMNVDEYYIQFMNVENIPEEELQHENERPENEKSENFEVFRKTGFSFNSVGGYELIKEELMQCADMLVHYEKYTKYNVRIPKGLILEGPPGNGKTLLAKCFSGEIDVAFIPVSGAQFQEKYVGVGASRVRELFELASKNTPCIIFIDELDALCRQRSSDGTSSRSEHDSTLNELLVNLDGFKSTPGIFIIGATNRLDLLDTAMTRPGRIDKKIYVGNPDLATRTAILRIHMKGKPMEKCIRLEDLLQMSQGYSGAQIENFLNEAMLHALRDKRTVMSLVDLETMATRTLTGYQSVESNVSREQLYQIAIHEMGHAFTAILTGTKVIKVSIHLWSPKSLGFTLFDTTDHAMLHKSGLMEDLMILLGGRVAEDIFFGHNVSTGASQDIEQTKQLAEKMIVKWGMGKQIIYPMGSEFYKKVLDQEIDELIQSAYKKTHTLLLNYSVLIQEMAKLLVDEREVKGNDLYERITS
jgi:cell division protease FtsH